MSIQEAQPQASTPSSTTGSSANSPAASHPPPTPLTPGSDAPYMALPTLPTIGENDTKAPAAANANGTSTAPSKRKPSRRANTAERRATHNAVERQRRETLNGRFLDLAALLPNLATVRRPSKSAIVNSSIALIHAHRRQRLLGARELRLLRCEGDALRRELNEWRDRAGLPRVEEPARSPEFFALMNAGAEGAEGGEGGGEGWWAAPGLGEMGEEERRAYELVVRGQQDEEDEGMEGDEEEYVAAVAARAGNFGKIGNNAANNNNIALQHIAPRFQQQQQQQQQQQMSFTRSNSVGGGPALGFDGMPSHPALGAGVHTMYEPNGHPHGASHALPVHPAFDQHHHQSHQSHHSHSQHNQHNQDQQDKLAWGMNNGLYGSAIAQPQWAHQVQVGHHSHGHGQQHGQQNPQALFTPPGTAGSTAGGNGAPSPVNFTLGSGVGSLGALGHGHVYASPELDDASSVGSVERGGSVGGGSPGPHGAGGSQGSFDMLGMGGVGMYGRKPSLSLDVGVGAGAGAGWNGSVPVPVPVSAGGGGNGGRHLNAMMMMM